MILLRFAIDNVRNNVDPQIPLNDAQAVSGNGEWVIGYIYIYICICM
jgi:hypothetical protein